MQVDGHSCGYLSLVVAMILVGEYQLPREVLKQKASTNDGGILVSVYHEYDMQALRLRILHLILFSRRDDDMTGIEAKVKAIEGEMNKHIPKTLARSMRP
jgi:hypothetical protein